MKRQATIWTVLMLAPLLALARGGNQAAMEIRTFDRTPIVVQMDGYTMNHRPDASVIIHDVFPGNRQVRVFVPEWRGGRQANRLLYHGTIQVYGNEQLSVVIGRNGQIQIDRQRYSRGWNGYGQTSCGSCTAHSQHCGHQQSAGYGQTGYGWNPDPWQGGYYSQNTLDLPDLRRAMQRNGFDSGKEDIAQTAVSHHNINSRQLREILEEFSFESTRLRFAKWAYPYVTDPENIFRIYDAFEFSSSVHDFRRFIDRGRR